MAVRYNKLWKILIDKKMKKKDLQEAAHITHYQINYKGEINGTFIKKRPIRRRSSTKEN